MPRYNLGARGQTSSHTGQNRVRVPHSETAPNVSRQQNANLRPNPGSNAISEKAHPAVESAALARLAQERNQYALNLAQRGAYFSAEEEYFKALWIVARKLDERHATATHSAALSAAQRAFEETKDFAKLLPDKADHDVRRFILGHKTHVLRGSPEPLPALSAMQAYYAYASEQLVLATGNEAVASTSLSGLAKIQSLLVAGPQESTAPAKAIALFQAAIAVDPKNAMASNELGVLLAKYGRFESARDALKQSLSGDQHPNSWRNLAKVYDILGEDQLAAQARKNWRTLKTTARTQNHSMAKVAWVDTETFAKQSMSIDASTAGNNSGADGRQRISEANHASTTRTAKRPTTQEKRKGLSRLLDPFRKGRKLY